MSSCEYRAPIASFGRAISGWNYYFESELFHMSANPQLHFSKIPQTECQSAQGIPVLPKMPNRLVETLTQALNMIG